MGIPILSGRAFTHAEIERQEAVAVVSESAARALWPGKDPLGQRVQTDAWSKSELPQAYTVIGVVKSVRSTFLSKLDSPFLYFPKPLSGSGLFLVRTRILPESVLPRALTALSGIHPNLPSKSFLVTIEQGPIQIQRLMAQGPALVSSALGFLALVLASVGIFGTVSYLVTQRTREIGIRIALGARNRDIIQMVLKQGLRAVAWGTGIGVIGAVGLSTLLSALVVMPDAPDLTHGVGAFDAPTFIAVLAVLCVVVLVAIFLPVRRATRVAPMVALRNE